MLYAVALLTLFGYGSIGLFFLGISLPSIFGLEFYEQEEVPEQEAMTYELPSFNITTVTLEDVFFEEEFFHDFDLRDNWLS